MRARGASFLPFFTLILALTSAPPAPATVHQWSRSFGDSDTQVVYGLVADDAGNVVTTGYIYGTADFGGGPLASAGLRDIFVAKHGPDGSHLWSKVLGDLDYQYGIAVAADSGGNVIVVGAFQGSVDFGGGALTSAGGYDVFVAKFNPLGVHLWSHGYGDANNDLPGDVAVDEAGNIIIAGQFAGSIDFGGGPLASAGAYDAFLAKLSPLGVHQWSHGYGDADNDLARCVALDGSGGPVVAGDFQGTLDLGGGPLASAGSYDVFVARFTTAGLHLWSQAHGDLNYETVRDIDLDSTDQVLLTGYFSGSIAFSPHPPLASAGGYDVFLAKLGPATGAALWSRGFGDGSSDYGYAVAVDDGDEVFVAGSFYGEIDFGLGPLTSAGASDCYLAKLAADGSPHWSEIFGDTDSQIGRRVDTDAERNLLMTGYFNGTIDFGGGPLASAGSNDIFLVKLLPADLPAVIGDRVWYDTDGDGIQDDGEPGIDGVPVYLYDDIGSLLDFTVSGAGGAYRFDGLAWTETYRLRFFPTPGYLHSPQDQGADDGLDSDADPVSGLTPSFALSRAADATRWDAGLVPVVSCWTPDEPLYIYEMTLTDDGNDFPVLHFMDPNQPDQVTGYNVYRAPDPGLPHESWSLVASNVIDMDEATPNKQWVDTSGESGTWYYQVAAYNHHCPPESAEGPW